MKQLFATTAAALLMAGTASAQAVTATAGTDLNMRSGPGVNYEVTGVIPGGDEVSVAGCLEAANWCEVTHGDASGWAYGDYLASKVGEEFQPIYPNRQTLHVPVVVHEEAVEPSGTRQAADAGMGAAAGATAGALVGGPLGAVIGAAAGAASSRLPDPAPEVRTYVEAHPQDAVLLDGEVVIGAGVPEGVTLYDIPDAPDYQYVTINGLPVLVNAEREIVYIFR
ncbi:DUF1236 domain-containing protein [Paracoccus sp. S-4012]|uniref:DUF1236 domain-containing protein n=1 Tax=Paracoccus sp. S-4012 TaxID=2665648 RepID=UPI0012B0685E|nr:DUF1236 domain-containing protein [Paracoccus sp. S-4012]MRX49657.1 DUF1236 domain-containing protein [Paracoccus sp. S-4012]